MWKIFKITCENYEYFSKDPAEKVEFFFLLDGLKHIVVGETFINIGSFVFDTSEYAKDFASIKQQVLRIIEYFQDAGIEIIDLSEPNKNG